MRKRCYYAVLELSLKATLCEIRHSYHKLAMKWHPDKNKSNEANGKFQEINEAYSILSDSSEKAWYDRHRETIIKNWNLFCPETSPASQSTNSLTGGENFWPYFVRPLYVGYDDSDNGFYTIYRNVFNALGDGVEEMNAFVSDLEDVEQVDLNPDMVVIKAPSFGNSETKLINVAQFYYYWEHLIPFMEAAWNNLCSLDLVERKHANKAEQSWRRKLIKTFVAITTNLVQYAKKRDPRYIKYLKNKAMIDMGQEQPQEQGQETDNITSEVKSYDLSTLVRTAENSNEVELFGKHKKICLKCWNWTDSQLKLLIPNNFEDVGWSELQLTDATQLEASKACLQYFNILSIAGATVMEHCTHNHENSNNDNNHKEETYQAQEKEL